MYLARAVVVVGLPYPNKFAIEMKVRFRYLLYLIYTNFCNRKEWSTMTH